VSIGYTAAAKMFSSTTRVCPSTSNGQIAGFLNPVLASCQLVHVARPGEEPDVWEATEDMRLLSPELADKNGEHRAGTTQQRHLASTRSILQQHKSFSGGCRVIRYSSKKVDGHKVVVVGLVSVQE